MKAKIIVAGAGHGGIIAGAALAKAGYEVHLYEGKKQDELGHDWEDRFTFSLLNDAVGKPLPQQFIRERGDCVFVSPSKRSGVKIKYNEQTRQKVAWRKPVINMLLNYAKESGVIFHFSTSVLSPVISDDAVIGVNLQTGAEYADLIIDALGVNSVLRVNLPPQFGITAKAQDGDVFYAYRAYYNLEKCNKIDYPFEVFLCHEREAGLSWFLTNDDNCDVLIGRTYPLNKQIIAKQISLFKQSHPQLGDTVLHGGNMGIIPVRRALPLMVARGYAAVGDSAFMTTPMNGMGIDLSINAGMLLANTIIKEDNLDLNTLWHYNRDFHLLYGAETAKNEGLKNALLNMHKEGVDFLFDNRVIEASDLSGAGKNTSIKTLFGKFIRGMKKPKYFFTLISSLIHGAKMTALYKKAPTEFDRGQIDAWQEKIQKQVVKIKDA